MYEVKGNDVKIHVPPNAGDHVGMLLTKCICIEGRSLGHVHAYMIDSDRCPVSNRRPLLKSAQFKGFFKSVCSPNSLIYGQFIAIKSTVI